MIKPILLALLICSCTATKQTFPTDTANEKLWKQQYSDGTISWAEYQSRLQNEKKP